MLDTCHVYIAHSCGLDSSREQLPGSMCPGACSVLDSGSLHLHPHPVPVHEDYCTFIVDFVDCLKENCKEGETVSGNERIRNGQKVDTSLCLFLLNYA